MERTKLEIKVFEEVRVVDSLKEAIMMIVEAFKKWVEGDMEKPFDLSVRKMQNKAPPSLEINVKEEVITKTAFG
jgi:dihydroxyacetone kinase-like predicted kinase